MNLYTDMEAFPQTQQVPHSYAPLIYIHLPSLEHFCKCSRHESILNDCHFVSVCKQFSNSKSEHTHYVKVSNSKVKTKSKIKHSGDNVHTLITAHYTVHSQISVLMLILMFYSVLSVPFRVCLWQHVFPLVTWSQCVMCKAPVVSLCVIICVTLALSPVLA